MGDYKMINYFVATHFNPSGYKSRDRLSKEFFDRCPTVVKLENINGYPGFCKDLIVDDFTRANFRTMKSITVFDADLCINSGFVMLLEHIFSKIKNFDSVPLYLQPFEHCEHVVPGAKYMPMLSTAACFRKNMTTEGSHCGLAYTLNRPMLLRLLEGTGTFLPRYLLFGSTDYIFSRLAMRQHIVDHGMDINKKLIKLSACFTDIEYNYLPGINIGTYFHGNRKDRGYNTRTKLYRFISYWAVEYGVYTHDDLDLFKKYMDSRNEDAVFNPALN